MADPKDIQVPEAPANASAPMPETTVKDLIASCLKSVKDYGLKYFAQAEYNERMISGDQCLMLSASYEVMDDDTMPDYAPRNIRNLLRNLSLTWSARILEDRPNIACYPAEPGSDQRKAEVATKVLEYCRQNQDFDDLCFRLAEMVQPHSCVGIKPVWDPLTGPRSQGIPVFDELGLPVLDPQTGMQQMERVGEPLGDVSWEAVPIFDYGTDGAEDIADAKWVYFVKHLDRYDALHLLRAAGYHDDEPSLEEYTDTWGNARTGVPVVELWWRPDSRFPKGLYAVQVGNHVIQAIDFPYMHGELPIAVWKCGHRRASPYGSTHVDDAVYIQKTINEIVSAMARQARQVRDIKLLGHSAVLQKLEAGNQLVPVDDVNISNAVRYLEPPDRAKVLVSSLEDNVNALYSVYGLNEMLTGAENVKSGTAAKSIAYLNKLDSMKMSGAARSLGKAILRVMRQTLKLYQQYATAPRIAHIAGSNNLFDALLFSKADIAGVDVRLEAASGYEGYRATVAQAAQEQMMQGGPTPELMAQQRTGLKQTAYDKAQREVVQAQIQALLRGEPQQADTSIDANIAVDELTQIMSQFVGSQFMQPLQQLLQSYQQAGASQQQGQAQEGEIPQ